VDADDQSYETRHRILNRLVGVCERRKSLEDRLRGEVGGDSAMKRTSHRPIPSIPKVGKHDLFPWRERDEHEILPEAPSENPPSKTGQVYE